MGSRNVKILVGSLVSSEKPLIKDFFYNLLSQNGCDLEFLFMLGPYESTYADALSDFGQVIDVSFISGQSGIVPHLWPPQRKRTMADIRNHMLETAVKRQFDYFLSIDNDVILQKNGLLDLVESLENSDGAAISPLVWMDPKETAVNVMHWKKSGETRYSLAERDYKEVLTFKVVDIVMACILMKPECLKLRYGFHPQGEDIFFAEQMAEANLKAYWLPSVKTKHIMLGF